MSARLIRLSLSLAWIAVFSLSQSRKKKNKQASTLESQRKQGAAIAGHEEEGIYIRRVIAGRGVWSMALAVISFDYSPPLDDDDGLSILSLYIYVYIHASSHCSLSLSPQAIHHLRLFFTYFICNVFHNFYSARLRERLLGGGGGGGGGLN